MASEFAQRIRSRCYWEVTIRPDKFESTRVNDYARLRPLVDDSVVELWGWPFPITSGYEDSRKAGDDWVGDEIDWQYGPSLWRIYQSGQFFALQSMWRDWEVHSVRNPGGSGPANFLPLWDTIRQFTEIYEFAARLSLTEAGDSTMHVKVKIGNLSNRTLQQDHPNKTPLRLYTFKAPSFSYPLEGSGPIPREVLVSDPRLLAAEGLAELFKRFDFNAGTQAIRAWQLELDKR